MWDEYDFTPYELISISKINFFNITSTIILRLGDDYFYLTDDDDKVSDVVKMPDYIKQDWVESNKKLLDVPTINREVLYFKKTVELFSEKPAMRYYELMLWNYSKTLENLISIRREIIMNHTLGKK